MKSKLAMLQRGMGVWRNYLSYYFGAIAPSPIGYVYLEITRRCQLKCTMCNIWNTVPNFGKEKKEEFSWQDWTKIIKNSRYLKMMPKIWLTGGEPFLRHDLVKLVCELLNMRHVYQVCLVSSGAYPNHIIKSIKSMLEHCPPDKVLEVCISIDGIAKQHDEIRGTPGLFEKVKNTLSSLCELRDQFPQLALICNATIQPANIDNIEEIRQFISEYNIKSSMNVMQKNAYYDNKNHELDSTNFNETQMSKLFSITKQEDKLVGTEQYFKMGVRPLRCYAGYNSVFITSKGNIYPCAWKSHDSHFLMGNVLDGEFDRVWCSEKTWRIRFLTKKCNDCWNVCEVRATQLQHLIWHWGIKIATLGKLDYYKLRGMR